MKRTAQLLAGGILAVCVGPSAGAPPPSATEAFDRYIGTEEVRLTRQHGTSESFLAGGSEARQRARHGELVIEKLTPEAQSLPGALLHHWRGTAFALGASAADFEALLRNFDAYPRVFSPQVERTRVLSKDGDRLQVTMRVRQKHVITVVLDSSYDVHFGSLDDRHGYSTSRSTKISEIRDLGTGSERPLGPSEEQGFLWRLNSYWNYAERDGGLYLQIEAVSLTRSVPRGLGWMIGPYIESIPRESLEFTLRSARDAMGKTKR
jgi:hypothetical protein